MADFAAIYFIQNDGGTYRAFDTEGTEFASGTALVADVLDDIEAAHAGNFAVHFGIGQFDMGTDNNWTLNGKDDVLISGQGIGLTHIFNTSTAASDTEPISITNCDRLTLRDLDLTAGGTARTTSDAIDLDNSDESLIERVRILGSRGAGIIIDGKDAGAQAIGNTIRDCIVTGCDLSGVELLAADDTLIAGGRFHGNGENGIKLNRKISATVQNCEGTRIVGVQCDNNDDDGIEILECVDITIVGCTIKNNGQTAGADDGISINDAATAGLSTDNITITGCLIYDDQGSPTQDKGVNVLDAAVTGVVIQGCTFHGHVTEPYLSLAVDTRVRGNVGAVDNTHREVTGATTLVPDEAASIFNCVAGSAYTVTLPDAGDAGGRGFLFHREGANNITISRAGTDTFEGGATTKVLADDGAGIGIYSIGDSIWKITGTQGSVT